MIFLLLLLILVFLLALIAFLVARYRKRNNKHIDILDADILSHQIIESVKKTEQDQDDKTG